MAAPQPAAAPALPSALLLKTETELQSLGVKSR